MMDDGQVDYPVDEDQLDGKALTPHEEHEELRGAAPSARALAHRSLRLIRGFELASGCLLARLCIGDFVPASRGALRGERARELDGRGVASRPCWGRRELRFHHYRFVANRTNQWRIV